LAGDGAYDRQDDDLQAHGLYVDIQPWNAAAFSLSKVTT
jgi:hypothetical protein